MAREIRTAARLWNLRDEVLAQEGFIRPEEVRAVQLEETVVDTGAMRLVLNEQLVQSLGLPQVGEITVRYADNRTARKRVAGQVAVEIMGRTGIFSAVIEERGEPLIGMIVLEDLDLWPDPQRGILTTNPLSPDIPLYNLFKVTPCPCP